MSTMTNILPHDVVVNILSRLPVKSLLRFRCVSKLWNNFFSDSSFIKMHLNQFSINNFQHLVLRSKEDLFSIGANNSNESSLADEVVEINYPFKTPNSEVEILGSCNGLLLIIIYDFLCIWNPSTKEFKKLPDTCFDFPKEIFTGCISIEVGFGYDKIIEDYKVVIIMAFDDTAHSSDVKVYTLGSDSWRRIKDIPDTRGVAASHELVNRYRVAAGKLVNGVLHWVANRFITYYHSKKYLDDDEEEKNSHIIRSINIEDEKFREIQQPDFIDTKFQMNVEVLGGCLCIMCNFHHVRSEIWVMKEYGVKESWTKLFTIDQPSYLRPVKFTKNGEVLFVKDNSSLVMYDPKHGSAAKTLQIRGLKDGFETDTYVESLISLNSGTFVGQEQAAWKRILKNYKKKEKKNDKNMLLKEQKKSCTYVDSLISLNSDTYVDSCLEQEQVAWKRTLKNRKKDLCFF